MPFEARLMPPCVLTASHGSAMLRAWSTVSGELALERFVNSEEGCCGGERQRDAERHVCYLRRVGYAPTARGFDF